MESSLREFRNIEPLNFWFEHPLHRLDTTGELEDAPVLGSAAANLAKSPKRTSAEERRERLDTAYDATALEGSTTVKNMAEYSGMTERSIYRYLEEYSDCYALKKGSVTKLQVT